MLISLIGLFPVQIWQISNKIGINVKHWQHVPNCYHRVPYTILRILSQLRKCTIPFSKKLLHSKSYGNVYAEHHSHRWVFILNIISANKRICFIHSLRRTRRLACKLNLYILFHVHLENIPFCAFKFHNYYYCKHLNFT